MQNSEAVQAWFQGKMASFRILGLVSKNEIRSREFSFSSRSLRVKIINLDLVSMPEIGGNFFSVSSRSLRVSVRNSRSRLDERDWIGETLILVSRLKKRLSLTTAPNAQTTTRSWFGIWKIVWSIIFLRVWQLRKQLSDFDFVTQWTILDKLRNSNYDIEG